MAAVILSAVELNHPTCQEFVTNKLSFTHQLNGYEHVFEQESINCIDLNGHPCCKNQILILDFLVDLNQELF